MRPVREIPDEFLHVDQGMGRPFPLVERFLAEQDGRLPFEGFRMLLVQHQLSNQVAMADALVRLGADRNEIYWLDIPYTSTPEVRQHLVAQHDLQPENFVVCSDYRVLAPYAVYQYARTVDLVNRLASAPEMPLLVLDDGAYVLKALSALTAERWPRPLGIVEQTTRGIIKLRNSAAMHAAAVTVPIVDVARSAPKRTLEPPFIAMAVCASLGRRVGPLLEGRDSGPALVLGYGAIGEQVATYLTARPFGLEKSRVFIHDTEDARLELARSRGFRAWDRSDLSRRFGLVIGCSGRASFRLGDRAFLQDGAILASASSGSVELSRKDFIELADATVKDDIEIERGDLDESDIHANVDIRLVDRTVTFANAGFPVNFDGSVNSIPARFIQQTPVMMIGAAIQAAEAVGTGRTGLLELDETLCTWVDRNFRDLLGDDAHYLVPPPEKAW